MERKGNVNEWMNGKEIYRRDQRRIGKRGMN